MKNCRSCLQKLPLSMFEKRKEGADGTRHQCRKCRSYKEIGRKRIHNPITANPSIERYTEKNPIKRKAKDIVNNALKAGKLKQKPCRICGKKAHAHHSDYSKSLDVVWFCPSHHKAWHRIFIPEVPVN